MIKSAFFLVLCVMSGAVWADQVIDPWNYGPVYLYPADPAQRLYKLPYDSGISHRVTGGYGSDPNTGYKHPDYSVDFDMAQGEAILAVRGGIVSASYYRDTDSICNIPTSLGNSVAVNRVDTIIDTTIPAGRRLLRTYDYYLHVRKGIPVKPGDTIAQGQVVAYASCTGQDGGGPHLHFKVYMPGHEGYFTTNPTYTFNSIPTPFVEITNRPNGIPEMYDNYVSQNKRVEPAAVESSVRTQHSPLSLTPNPAANYAVAALTANQINAARIEVLDPKGRRMAAPVRSTLLSGERHEYGLDVSALPNGVYVCRVITMAGLLTRRLVILR